jgi:hypothetical protein
MMNEGKTKKKPQQRERPVPVHEFVDSAEFIDQLSA